MWRWRTGAIHMLQLTSTVLNMVAITAKLGHVPILSVDLFTLLRCLPVH